MTSKLTEGVYVDDDGTLHIDVARVIVANGYEPTPENKAVVERAARSLADTIGAKFEVDG